MTNERLIDEPLPSRHIMVDPAAERAARLRWSIYAILIAISTGSLIGRILAVDAVDRIGLERKLQQDGRPNWKMTRPFLSANDRSRWATVRSLVELGTYEIEDIVSQPGWDSIDIVMHRGPDGEKHLYSSKPPLFATLMAGEYWLIQRVTGATLGTHPYEIGRFMLITINVLPMIVYFIFLAKLAECFGTTDWSRIFMVAAGTFGTFLTTFAVTINNHLPAAVCAAIALLTAARIWYDGRREARYFIVCGLFAALTVAWELPALAFFALLTLGLLWKARLPTLVAYLPAAAVVAAAALGTNYAAHGTLWPAYAYRAPANQPTEPVAAGEDNAKSAPSADKPSAEKDDWYHFSYTFPNGKTITGYKNDPKGIDLGEPSRANYVLQCLIGHHGIFSLTPIWLLSLAGVFLLWRDGHREASLLIAATSLVCLAFYCLLPQIDRNYGGMTSGLRWMFWFAPFWLVALLPTVDRLAMTWPRRSFALVLLAWSAMSAAYPTWNPWTHPWLLKFFQHLGTTYPALRETLERCGSLFLQ